MTKVGKKTVLLVMAVTAVVVGIGTYIITQPEPTPARFETRFLRISPQGEIELGDSVTIRAEVYNKGDKSGSYTAELRINGKTVDSETVTIQGGDGKTVKFEVVKKEPGLYNIELGGLTGSFEIPWPGLEVKVQDTEGNPVSGAYVNTVGQYDRTSADGYAFIRPTTVHQKIPNGTYDLHVLSKDHLTLTTSVEVPKDTSITVTLRRGSDDSVTPQTLTIYCRRDNDPITEGGVGCIEVPVKNAGFTGDLFDVRIRGDEIFFNHGSHRAGYIEKEETKSFMLRPMVGQYIQKRTTSAIIKVEARGSGKTDNIPFNYTIKPL